MTVLFFGQLAEIAGTPEIIIRQDEDKESFPSGELNTGTIEMTNTRQMTNTNLVSTTTGLKAMLLTRFPGLADLVFNIAVDSVIINGETDLKPGCTVALLPPFSGG